MAAVKACGKGLVVLCRHVFICPKHALGATAIRRTCGRRHKIRRGAGVRGGRAALHAYHSAKTETAPVVGPRAGTCPAERATFFFSDRARARAATTRQGRPGVATMACGAITPELGQLARANACCDAIYAEHKFGRVLRARTNKACMIASAQLVP